jgi:hypothetical protein
MPVFRRSILFSSSGLNVIYRQMHTSLQPERPTVATHAVLLRCLLPWLRKTILELRSVSLSVNPSWMQIGNTDCRG